MVSSPRFTSFDRRKLHTPTQDRAHLLAAYYAELNADPAFRCDLATTFDQLDTAVPLADLARALGFALPVVLPVPTDAELGALNALASLPQATAQLRVYAEYVRALSEARRVLGAFARRWSLSPEGIDHLLTSYVNRRVRGDVLSIAPTEGAFPPAAVVSPPPPQPFTYSPVLHGRAWLNQRIDAICRELRASMLEQADKIDQNALATGWAPRPPRRRDNDLATVAHRLYLRAVKRLTWGQIVVAEHSSGHDITRASVRKSVVRLAHELGIPLPP